MLRYAITDGRVLESGGSRLLWEQAAVWAANSVNYVQLREKDLSPAGLAQLARGVLQRLHGSRTRLLINGRPDVAVAIGAHGVHLTSAPGELTPSAVRAIFDSAGLPRPIVSVSTHTIAEVQRAVKGHADLILFGPIFGKLVAGEEFGRRLGLDALRQACAAAARSPNPGSSKLLALGGITQENTPSAIEAGAAGIAGIRLFARSPKYWRPPLSEQVST